jgi:hypothetical protein
MTTRPGAEAAVDLRVVDVDVHRDPRWDEFVCGHPEGLVFHHSAWLQTLEHEYSSRFLALGCEDGQGRLQGVLPLVFTRGLPLRLGGPGARRRLSSLPRTPLAGPLATSRAALATLAKAAVDYARAEPGLVLQLKLSEPTLDGLVDGLVGTEWRLNYVLELPDDPDAVRFGNSRNHARIRWAVNKASRSGVHVRPAEREAELRAWYSLYLHVNRWRLQPPRPYRLFEAAWNLLRPLGMMRLLLAEHRSGNRAEMLAGSVFLMHGATVFYAFNGARRDALSLRPNDIIQWHAIHDAVKEGFRRYDFGEVSQENHDLAAFKSKWGTEAQPLHRYYFPAPRGVNIGYGSLESERRVRRVGTRVWRHLPLRATALVGDRVYHYL